MLPDGSLGGSAVIDLGVRAVQIAWLLLLLAGPFLCWRAGRVVGIGGGKALVAVTIAAVLALFATWRRGDEPLHANGHAWREAREVLAPWGQRANREALFMYGRGAISLEWLLADAERRLTGTANPFRISRVAGAAAAGGTALLAAILVRSVSAGLAAGCALALMPLAQTLSVSGSALSILAWIIPWSLALMLAAARAGDRFLLLGATLATVLGTLCHTAMLTWAPAMLAVWIISATPGIRTSQLACGAFLVMAGAWILQADNSAAMVMQRNAESGGGLLTEVRSGVMEHNLFVDSQWVSPLLVPLVLLWVIFGVWRGWFAAVAASVLSLLLVAPPFFAVTASSSDAVRYQGALLGLVTGMAVAGIWVWNPTPWLGRAAVAIVRATILATLILLPPAAWRPPLDPVAVEHRLVEQAVRKMKPGTLVVLPAERFAEGRVINEFPDFLLPDDSYVLFAGDPRIRKHDGPQLFYLGLACISWGTSGAADPSEMRSECRTLGANAHPWMVRSLRSEDLPRGRRGGVWTFHRLATNVPFGFFAVDPRD